MEIPQNLWESCSSILLCSLQKNAFFNKSGTLYTPYLMLPCFLIWDTVQAKREKLRILGLSMENLEMGYCVTHQPCLFGQNSPGEMLLDSKACRYERCISMPPLGGLSDSKTPWLFAVWLLALACWVSKNMPGAAWESMSAAITKMPWHLSGTQFITDLNCIAAVGPPWWTG